MIQELCFLTATELAARIRAREVSCEQVMRAHLDQIARVNPKVNAIVTLVPEEQALGAARAADAKLARGERVGPLHGLPIAHKDLLQTKGMRTTFGSPIFRDFVPDTDAILADCDDLIAQHRLDPNEARQIVGAMLRDQPLALAGDGRR